jgi:hypothetical protein
MGYNPNSTGTKTELNGSTSGNFSQFASAVTTSYSITWPAAQAASSGYVLTNNGSGILSWAAASSPLAFADSLVNTAGNVTLVNDTASPGASSYYGTNGSSVLGYYSLPVSGINQLTGDVTAGPGTGSQVATLATVNSNVGSFTNASITVNAKGLITAASSGSTASTSVQTTEIAGQSFTGSTLYAVKYMMSGDSGFVAGRVFAADDNAATTDNFYAIGLVYSPTTVAIAGTIVVTEEGILNVPSHGFTVGAPIYLGASGACIQTAPSTTGLAVVRVGIAKDANNIWVDVVPVGVN